MYVIVLNCCKVATDVYNALLMIIVLFIYTLFGWLL